jgi:hypothetical protein
MKDALAAKPWLVSTILSSQPWLSFHNILSTQPWLFAVTPRSELGTVGMLGTAPFRLVARILRPGSDYSFPSVFYSYRKYYYSLAFQHMETLTSINWIWTSNLGLPPIIGKKISTPWVQLFLVRHGSSSILNYNHDKNYRTEERVESSYHQ